MASRRRMWGTTSTSRRCCSCWSARGSSTGAGAGEAAADSDRARTLDSGRVVPRDRPRGVPAAGRPRRALRAIAFGGGPLGADDRRSRRLGHHSVRRRRARHVHPLSVGRRSVCSGSIGARASAGRIRTAVARWSAAGRVSELRSAVHHPRADPFDARRQLAFGDGRPAHHGGNPGARPAAATPCRVGAARVASADGVRARADRDPGGRGVMTTGVRARSALLVSVCALLALPAAARAHAYLETSTPGPGAALSAAPHTLKLLYDEDVVPEYARVGVVTARGQNLAGPPIVAGPVVTVALRPGPAGSYTVRWQMVATSDGHETEGAFSFGLRAKALPPAPAHGVGVPVAPDVLAWLEFVGVVLAGGALTFRAMVLAPAERVLGEAGAGDAPVAIWAGIVGAVLALHAGLFGFFVGAYPIVGGGLLNFANTQIIPIRTATHLGQAWTLTTFAWLGVLALLVGAWVTPRRRESLLTSAGVRSLAIAFGISWASHPASHGALALAADYVHLLASALWGGGLVAPAIFA